MCRPHTGLSPGPCEIEECTRCPTEPLSRRLVVAGSFIASSQESIMYRHFFTARQLVGAPAHLGSGNRVSVPTSITGSRRVLATVLLAAVLCRHGGDLPVDSRSSYCRRDQSHSGKRGLAHGHRPGPRVDGTEGATGLSPLAPISVTPDPTEMHIPLPAPLERWARPPWLPGTR